MKSEKLTSQAQWIICDVSSLRSSNRELDKLKCGLERSTDRDIILGCDVAT